MKLNCWEYKNCTVGMNSSVPDNEKCHAAKITECNPINNGINGGRICWSVSGTLCNTMHRGQFTKEIISCLECDFYKLVLKEEKRKFKLIKPLK